MCIAVYVPKNIEIGEATLRECFRCNPDGAGIMFTDGKSVYIEKGIMKVDEFVTAFNNIPKEFERSFHCRIATSGRIEEGCTHPFPVTSDMKDMKKISVETDIGIAHNGIISWCAPEKGKEAWYSDTMYFISNIIHPLRDQIHNKVIKELIERSTSGNKFIIMTPEKVEVLGFFTQEGGVFYSNTSFRLPVTTTAGTRTYTYGGRTRNPVASLEKLFWVKVLGLTKYQLNWCTEDFIREGIEVVEEGMAYDSDGKLVGLFLVDKLPTKKLVYGSDWVVINPKLVTNS